MKKLLLIIALAFSAGISAQAITVNTNSHTVPQLVNDVLINSPCVSATNVTWKTGSQFGSTASIGYFQNSNSNFPMESGVILTTGNVASAPGPNVTEQNEGNLSWTGDSDLEATLSSAGIAMNSVNATVLEFDFQPISSTFSFDFLFASEEYGNYQCDFSDAFAFLLTNTATGVTTNLAIVPGTNLPISVVTIRDQLYNSICASANPQYFGTYNGGSAAAGSATNFNGQTKLLNASAVLTPNVLYHIKLVIADRSDSDSDSSIFIKSETFNIGQDVLGPDVTVAANNAICFGQPYTINSGLSASEYSFTWKKNGQPVVGETGSSLTITSAGTYEITYTDIINNCVPVTDSVLIQYLPELITQNPINLYKCIGSGTYVYDLSLNTPIVKTGLDAGTIVTYHSSAADAAAGTPSLQTTHTSAGNETIFVRIKNPVTGCYTVKSFQLLTAPAPIANQPTDWKLCERSATLHSAIFLLSTKTPEVLLTQSATTNIVTYHTSQAHADAGTNALGANYIAADNTVVYVRIQNATDATCYSTTSFTLYVEPLPLVDVLDSLVLCEPYTLPALVNGNYFSAPNGGGIPMFAGDIIPATQTIYIFNQPGGPDACSAKSQFTITIIDPLTLSPGDGTFCGNYTLPGLANGNYYTAPGGPTGTGTLLHAGDLIETSQVLYVYFQSLVTPFCIVETDFDVTINPAISIANFTDVFDCSSYTLPTLTQGKYFTEPDGQGTEIPELTQITSTQKIYVFAQGGAPNFCKSEVEFTVFIGLIAPPDVSQCNDYILPALPIGTYHTAPAGGGTIIPDGTAIAQTTTVYIYVPTTTQPNCTDDVHYTISIAQPLIDHPANAYACESYTLPPLTNGTYYTGTEQSGLELAAGTVITSSKTIYVFKRSTPVCFAEHSFTITIQSKPIIDSRSDIDACQGYVLTPLSVGNYYTGSGGTGTLLPAGTVINSTQTIYIYGVGNSALQCPAENNFTITVFTVVADSPANVSACDSYVLPALNVGSYYTISGGPNAFGQVPLQAGDIITNTQTIYVFAESAERNNCTDEKSFTVTITHTPFVAPIDNKYACNSYVLPALTLGDYYTQPNKGGTLLHANDVITTTQTLYVYSEAAANLNCHDEKSFIVTIFNVDEMPDVTICQGYTLPALTIGKYYSLPNGAGPQLAVGSTVTTSKTIYIYATSPFTPVCSDESEFVVTIIPEPTANPVGIALRTACDEDGTNDGVFSFNLTTLNAAVLGTQTGTEFTVNYYASIADANAGTNPISATTATTAFVRVNNILAPNCFDVKQLTLIINKIPEPTPADGIICYDTANQQLLRSYTIQSGLSPATHTFIWLNEAGNTVGTLSSYTAILPGEYSVIATNNATGCASKETFVTVFPSQPALISTTITDDFTENQIITVQAYGVGGDYEYQLNFGPWQDSNIFADVATGTHTINVRDKNGCGDSTAQALVVNYPKFFTPNGDGFNDTWNISDLNHQPDAIISIYDRYGKFLGKIKPSGSGWDGMLNGKELPSTDYWFAVNYEEDGIAKEFRAHFAMKR